MRPGWVPAKIPDHQHGNRLSSLHIWVSAGTGRKEWHHVLLQAGCADDELQRQARGATGGQRRSPCLSWYEQCEIRDCRGKQKLGGPGLNLGSAIWGKFLWEATAKLSHWEHKRSGFKSNSVKWYQCDLEWVTSLLTPVLTCKLGLTVRHLRGWGLNTAYIIWWEQCLAWNTLERVAVVPSRHIGKLQWAGALVARVSPVSRIKSS